MTNSKRAGQGSKCCGYTTQSKVRTEKGPLEPRFERFGASLGHNRVGVRTSLRKVGRAATRRLAVEIIMLNSKQP